MHRPPFVHMIMTHNKGSIQMLKMAMTQLLDPQVLHSTEGACQWTSAFAKTSQSSEDFTMLKMAMTQLLVPQVLRSTQGTCQLTSSFAQL